MASAPCCSSTCFGRLGSTSPDREQKATSSCRALATRARRPGEPPALGAAEEPAAPPSTAMSSTSQSLVSGESRSCEEKRRLK